MKAELATAHDDVKQYARSEYGAASLADAVRKHLPDADAIAVAGTVPLRRNGRRVAAPRLSMKIFSC